MQKFIFLIGLTLLLGVERANSQTIPCPDLALPYQCLDKGTGWGIYAVADVPLYLSSGNEIVHWQGNQPITIFYTTPDVTNHPYYSECIRQADLDQCIANDFAAWTNICPGMFSTVKVGALTSPGIDIVWDRNSSNFSTSTDQNGNVSIAGGQERDGYYGPNSQLERPRISLNNSLDFNDLYVFTTCPQKCTVTEPQKPVSICEVLLHEIGHAFGLLDLDENDPRFPQSVMWGEITAGRHACPGKGIADIDQCYFCKLYCPDNCTDLGAPLPPRDSSMALSIYPNPSSGVFTVVYRCKSRTGRITIEDMLGKKVLPTIKVNDASGVFQCNSQSLASGCYLLRLYSDGYYIVRLLIVR